MLDMVQTLLKSFGETALLLIVEGQHSPKKGT